MVNVKVYSHDWAELETRIGGKPHRCEVMLKHDLLTDKKGHKKELERLSEMDWNEVKREYRGCH